jgi:hypothetical protein
MPNELISDLFNIQNRFLRSANLERDFADPKALKGYILTAQTRDYVERLVSGLRDKSGQRAWRITGDYGSGKSSFALLLAHLLGREPEKLPEHLRGTINFKALGISRPRLLPVLVTGSQEPLASALLKAVLRDVLATCGRGRPPAVIDRIQEQLNCSGVTGIPESVVVQLLTEASGHLVSTGKASGMLVLLDELGKFLEYGALHPDRQDVFLLQVLAETAARSGQTPLFIVGLLHQGFNAYSEHLSQSAQREWDKVAGRFDELLFSYPLEHTALLIADALNIRKALPKGAVSEARRDMATLLDIGWYGAPSAKLRLIDLASKLYPLHPSVLPVLVHLFSRYGQNERSLFSFLLSNEPFGLQEFARRSVSPHRFYRIHDLYDYARYSFGHRLSRQSFRSHWNHIDSMIASFGAESENELQVLKTVGLLNLLDNSNLLASEDLLSVTLAGDDPLVKRTVHKLKTRRVLYHRGLAGGYCLWPHTSVNLEKVYDDASRRLGETPQKVAAQIEPYLETRPLVARRHYIKTGNLRHFEVRFSTVEQLGSQLDFDEDTADGRIIVALCETEDERETALRFARSEAFMQPPGTQILCAVPSPLRALARLVQEVQRWEWVAANTQELNDDPFAAEEVSRQLSGARDALQQRIRAFIGLQHVSGGSELTWFRKTKQLEIRSGRDLLTYLSTVCDEIYPDAPLIANELVNRRTLSSAAAAARMRLIERIFTSSSEDYLGMDRTKKPPEMSIYVSILKNAAIHRETEQGWGLRVPDAPEDPCSVRPALLCIEQMFQTAGAKRVKVSDILNTLRRAPLGIRDGLGVLLVSIFAVIHQQHVAFYGNGTFMREMVGLDLMRMAKHPDIFEIQYCKMAGVRTQLFQRLLKVLELRSTEPHQADILDVVRPLCMFAAELPPFTQKTKKLSAPALAVRGALLAAREPAILLFRDLPSACGFAEFSSAQNSIGNDVDAFVAKLKEVLDELRMAYPQLQERIKAELINAFGLTGTTRDFRTVLGHRSEHLILDITEPRLRAFCNRLIDTQLGESEWLDSIGSLLCSLPPTRWSDTDTERYTQELAQMCARFLRVESIAFEKRGRRDIELAMRLSITQRDGSEVDQVIYLAEDERTKVLDIEAQVSELLRLTPRAALAGTAKALWNALLRENGNG